MPGKVYLIGMGPGDPDLITLKAIKAMKKCDVLVYDRLANPRLLDHNESAERIFVGKTPGQHTKTQSEINAIIADLALAGKNVGRLKGGDPFVFGRGGEEALYLKRFGISYEVIAGITSAVAVPQYAGIPVTHRGYATSFHVVTGHENEADDKAGRSNTDWEALAKVRGTLIFLMGVEKLDSISAHLIGNGKPADCPAAVIMNGTLESQKEVYGTLSDIKRKCEENGIKSPAVIVVGEVAGLNEALDWRKTRPLYGMKVVSTRPEEKNDALIEKLEALGARVYKLPCIKIQGIKNVDIDEEMVAQTENIVFSSTYGVKYFMEGLKNRKIDIRKLKAKIFGVGPSVMDVLERYGIMDCAIPQKYNAESLSALIKENVPLEQGLLVVSGSLGSEKLMENTAAYMPKQLVVYETLEGCYEKLSETVDVLLFTSPSTVRGFLTKHSIDEFCNTPALCMGESTLQQAEESGFARAVALPNADLDALAAQLLKWRNENV